MADSDMEAPEDGNKARDLSMAGGFGAAIGIIVGAVVFAITQALLDRDQDSPAGHPRTLHRSAQREPAAPSRRWPGDHHRGSPTSLAIFTGIRLLSAPQHDPQPACKSHNEGNHEDPCQPQPDVGTDNAV